MLLEATQASSRIWIRYFLIQIKRQGLTRWQTTSVHFDGAKDVACTGAFSNFVVVGKIATVVVAAAVVVVVVKGSLHR